MVIKVSYSLTDYNVFLTPYQSCNATHSHCNGNPHTGISFTAQAFQARLFGCAGIWRPLPATCCTRIFLLDEEDELKSFFL